VQLAEQRMSASRAIAIRYTVSAPPEGWELVDEIMPESVPHDRALALLRAVLDAWVARSGSGAFVVRNLAVRWLAERPAVGVDPDVAVLAPAPPDPEHLPSLCTWLPGHVAPLLAIEVVSTTNPHKDYVIAPEKYAASGTQELWVFDPLGHGPTSRGGPYVLQQWRREEDGTFVRTYAGAGPVYSPALGAYAIAVGESLRIADDVAGTTLWPTGEEAALAAKDAERAAKDAALARVAELERRLAERE
jgi:Uma2 family endonuclease